MGDLYFNWLLWCLCILLTHCEPNFLELVAEWYKRCIWVHLYEQMLVKVSFSVETIENYGWNRSKSPVTTCPIILRLWLPIFDLSFLTVVFPFQSKHTLSKMDIKSTKRSNNAIWRSIKNCGGCLMVLAPSDPEPMVRKQLPTGS